MTSLIDSPAARAAPAGPGAPAVLELARHGSRVAVRTQRECLTYTDLARRVDEVAARLGPTRRLVLVEGTNTVEALVAHLAALGAGHVVLLTAPGDPAYRLGQCWDPDVVVRDGVVLERRAGTRHDLHPDLALLLSTSGSTGAPRLARLSHDNLRSNAASIADYLGLRADDCALTSLPLHYCYGLSVVHSHLSVGAALAVTDLSVVDPCFWRLAETAGATSLAGVPYTVDLLESAGLDPARVPTLRRFTVAGGRLAPERVRAWSARGRRAGWDLVVMYGATEATARMAWLPPELAESHPASIGVAVPGGSLRVDPLPGEEPGVGELVYTGPNVMLGYAATPADLARGREVEELRTGDLAREVDGLIEVVGRQGRQVKLFGLRLDLDHLERLVGERLADECVAGEDLAGTEVRCVVVEQTLHAFHAGPSGPASSRAVAEIVASSSGLPPGAVRTRALGALPRTASGKPDLAALSRLAAGTGQDGAGRDASARGLRGPVLTQLCRDYAVVLGRDDVDAADSFVSLGGDSLSYVELATRLGERVDLPPDWHTRPVRDLVGVERARGVRVESGVVLRALAIVAIVATHANLLTVVGGAHLLLVLAGHGFARFQLAGPTRRARVRHGLSSLARVVVPASLWIGAVGLVTGAYSPATALFLNGAVGSDTWTVQWQHWFLEALIWSSVLGLALIAVPALDRRERREPWRFALGLVLVALLVRFAWVGLEAGPTQRYTVGVVVLWFALGWAAARADSGGRRWVVVGLTALGTVGFFGDPWREGLVVAGVAVLVHVPTLRLPRQLARAVSVLAAASLYVYLTHWQVYPHLEDERPLAATVASFAVGIGLWWALRRVVGRSRPSTAPSGSDRALDPTPDRATHV